MGNDLNNDRFILAAISNSCFTVQAEIAKNIGNPRDEQNDEQMLIEMSALAALLLIFIHS